jgi:hypothetical protein
MRRRRGQDRSLLDGAIRCYEAAECGTNWVVTNVHMFVKGFTGLWTLEENLLTGF